MKNFTFGILLLGTFFSQTGFAAPEDCLPLTGLYTASRETPGYDPASLQISYDRSSKSYELIYGTRYVSRYRVEVYVVDGVTRPGDTQWTGNTYTAVCNSGVLKIVKDFSSVHPNFIITSTISASGDILTEEISLPNGYHRLQGHYLRTR